jgi:hypothetical protein
VQPIEMPTVRLEARGSPSIFFEERNDPNEFRDSIAMGRIKRQDVAIGTQTRIAKEKGPVSAGRWMQTGTHSPLGPLGLGGIPRVQLLSLLSRASSIIQ